MFETSSDVLNFSLAIGFGVLVVFLSILIFYTILVLRDISKVADKFEQLVSRVHATVEQPLKAVDYVIEKAKPYLETAAEKVNEKIAKRKKK